MLAIQAAPDVRDPGDDASTSLQAAPAHGLRRAAGWVIRWGAVAYMLVATFPLALGTYGIGLDPGSVYAVNAWAHEGYRFGRDVVYTSGPLGFLLFPLDVGPNLKIAVAVNSLLHVAFGVLVFYQVRRQRMSSAVVLFSLAYTAAISRGMLFEYRLLILVALLLLVDPNDRWWWRIAFPTAGFVAGLCVVTRFTVGLGAIAMVGCAAAVRLVRREIGLRAVAVSAGTVVGALGISAVLFLGGLGYLPGFLRGSWEISSGYAAAMSIVIGGGAVPGFGIAAAGVGLTAMLAVYRTRLLGVLMVAPFFLVFKHAYVRHQGEKMFPFLLAALAVAILISRSRRNAVVLCLASAAVVGSMLGNASYWDYPKAVPHWDLSTLGGERGARNLLNVARVGTLRDRLAAERRRDLAVAVLPAEWIKRIRMTGGAVDVVPWEIGIIPANDLPWEPAPAFQTFAAYTQYLDHWNAEHYLADDGPLFVIAGFHDIDGRHPMMAAPQTWRAVLARYRAVARRGSAILLQRRSEPTPAPVAAGATTTRIGEWTAVPSGDDLLFAGLRFSLRPMGALIQAAWRIGPVWIDLRTADGATRRYRIVPATAGGGLLLGGTPLTFTDFAALFDGRPPRRRVTQFRIHGPGARYYEDPVEVAWQRGP